MGKTVIRDGLTLGGTLGSGLGDPQLTRDTITKEVGEIPAVDTTGFISTNLLSAYLIVGNSSNIATPRLITGDVTISNLGVSTISNDVITNAQINTGAGITYSKLSLTNSIVNNDIATNANIARTKLAAASPYRLVVNGIDGLMTDATAIAPNFALISDSNGIPKESTVTTTQLGYVDATSSIQTQLNNKLNFDVSLIPAEGDIITYTGGQWVNFPKGSSGQYLTSTPTTLQWISAPGGLPNGGNAGQYLSKIDGTDFNTQWSDLTLSKITDITASAAQVNVLASGFYDATSSIQTQIGSKLNNSLSPGAIFVGNFSSTPTQLSPASNGQVLTLVAGYPQWQTVTGTGTVTSVDVSGGTSGLSFTGGPVTTTGTITLGGTLIAGHGGTGQSSYTIGDLLYASSTSALSKLAAGTNTYVLTSNGAGTAPSWQAPAGGVTPISGSGLTWVTNHYDLGGTLTSNAIIDTAGNQFQIGTTTSRAQINLYADDTNGISQFGYYSGSLIRLIDVNGGGVGSGYGEYSAKIGDVVNAKSTLLQISGDYTTPTTSGFKISNGSLVGPTLKFQIDLDNNWTINLGSDASQDIYKRNSSGHFVRIPVGSNGQFLGVNAGNVEWVTASATGVTSVSGTTNRITSTGGATPVIDISATFESLLGKVANPLSQFAATTSAQLRSVLTDELGTGAALFDGATPTSFIGTNITGTATGLTAGSANTLTTGRTISITGDLTYTSPVFDGASNVTAAGTLATVNSNVGTFGSATQVGAVTVNGKGLITAASSITITPAITSVTGLGAGVATALGIAPGTAGSFIVNAGSNGTLNANTNNIFYPSTTQSGTTYTVQSTDNHSTIRFTNSSPITVTLPNSMVTNFDVILKKMGTGTITVVATGTLTAAANTIEVQNTGAYFQHVGSNVWEGVGALGPSALSLNVGVTTISSGTSGRVAYNNSGVYGELPTTGSGSVVLSTGASLTTPALGTPTTINLTNATALPLTTGVTGILPPANGGTGVNNSTRTITLGGNFSTIGAFTTSLTVTNNTAVTLPITGTLSTIAGSETLTNKTLTSPIINYGSDANGDILVRQSGAYNRLAVGSTNQVLRVSSGVPGWGNPLVYSLFDDYTDVSNSSTTETDLYTHTIAANTLSANGNKISAEFAGSFVTTGSNPASVSNKVAVYFAGTKIFDPGGGYSVSTESGWKATVLLIRSSSSVIRCTIVFSAEGTLVTRTVDVSSLDFTIGNILKITGQGAASSFITAKIGSIIFKY